MERKFFPADKNYILRDAQAESRERMLRKTIEVVRQRYLDYYNPLGLVDNTITKITGYDVAEADLTFLIEFYDSLSGIYRYQYGSNQLELLFEGRSHQEKYASDWEDHYFEWVEAFCFKKCFITAIFEATIFAPADQTFYMVGRRLKVFLKQQFDLNICHRRGFPVLKSA